MKFKIITILVYLFTFVLIAQTDTLKLSADEIQSLVDKIGVKLLLNANQKNEVSEILSTYSPELKKLQLEGNDSENEKNKLIENLDSKIEALLDAKQKMKYEILKKEWWESVKSEEKD